MMQQLSQKYNSEDYIIAQLSGELEPRTLANMEKKERAIFFSKENLLDDLNIDSLDLAELVCRIEDKYNIEISESIFDEIKAEKNTVQDFINYINTQINN